MSYCGQPSTPHGMVNTMEPVKSMSSKDRVILISFLALQSVKVVASIGLFVVISQVVDSFRNLPLSVTIIPYLVSAGFLTMCVLAFTAGLLKDRHVKRLLFAGYVFMIFVVYTYTMVCQLMYPEGIDSTHFFVTFFFAIAHELALASQGLYLVL